MASVNTNAAAITALRTLQNTNAQLDATQNRISTGLKIGEAKDNAAYWSISTTLKSDNKSLSTVKDALGLGSATVDVAYQGLNKAKDVLDEIKSKLVAATQPGIDKNVIQSEIAELQKQLVSIAGSSVFSGENWLSVDSSATDYDATKKIVSSFSRDANNSVSIGTVDVAIGGVALFDKSTVAGKDGILDGMQNLKDKDGKDLKIGGTPSTTGNSNSLGLVAAGTTGKVDGAVTAPGAAGGAASQVAYSAATATPTNPGTPATAAAGVSSNDGTLGDGYASGDFVAFTFSFNGSPVNVARLSLNDAAAGSPKVATTGTLTATDVRNWLNADAGFSTVATADLDATGKLRITQKPSSLPTDTTTPAFTFSMDVYDDATNSNAASHAGGSAVALGTRGNVSGTGGAPGTYAAVTTGALDTTKLTDGDKLTFKVSVDGGTTVKDVTVTYKAATPNGAAGEFNTTGNIGAALTTALTTAGINTSVTASYVSGVTPGIKFEQTANGAANTLKLMDVVRTTTGGAAQNLNGAVATGTGAPNTFVASRVGSVTTGVLSFGTANGLQTGDKVSIGLTVNGTQLTAVEVTPAANTMDGLISAINTSTLGTSVTATKDAAGTALILTSKATGSTSAVQIDTISFKNTDGNAVNRSATGFNNVATLGSATVGAPFPAAGITLDANDSISFNIAVDGGVAKTVTIDQALVNKTLTTTTPARTVTDGKMTTAADFKAVADKALQAAGVTGLVTSLGGGANDQLVFTSNRVGTGSSVAITAAEASQGANQISVAGLDISDAGLSKLNVTSSDDVTKVLTAYISVVNNAINQVTTAAANLGAVASRIDMQKDFVNTLMDTIDKGVGSLVDADMSEESTKLQALQVKQQLGVQALSIANQSSQNILSLFR